MIRILYGQYEGGFPEGERREMDLMERGVSTYRLTEWRKFKNKFIMGSLWMGLT